MTLGAILSTGLCSENKVQVPPCCVALRNLLFFSRLLLPVTKVWNCSVLAPRPGNTTQASDEAPPLLLVASKFVPAYVGEGPGPHLLKHYLRIQPSLCTHSIDQDLPSRSLLSLE